MTAPEVVLHIGQPKTGTTTFQSLLARNRSRLADAGVLYPDIGEVNQWLAMADVLRHDPEAGARRPAGLQRHLDEIAGGLDGQFARLAEQCRDASASRIIISAENLVYAGDYTISRLRRLLQNARSVNVVITTRSASSLLSSAYQQLARIQAVADFDGWLRVTLDAFLANPDRSAVGWVWPDSLQRRWTQPGWHSTIVDMNGRPEMTTAKLWQLVVPSLPCPDLLDVENRGYPAALTAATQAFVRRHPHLTVARLQGIERRAFAESLRDPDYGALGRFTLKPDVASLVDGADFEQLQERLRAPEPLTYVELASGVSQRDWLKQVKIHASLLNEALRAPLARRVVGRVGAHLRSMRRVAQPQ